MAVGVHSSSRALPEVLAMPFWYNTDGQRCPRPGWLGVPTWWRHTVPVPGRVGAQREQHHIQAKGKHPRQARVENEVKQ